MTLAHADRKPDPAENISHLFGAAGCRSQVVGRQRTWVTSEEHAAKMVRGTGGIRRCDVNKVSEHGRRYDGQLTMREQHHDVSGGARENRTAGGADR